ncbi:hypothetical protein WJX84_010811 [Apatococcus fuscideae]|uniref:PARP catalytic domain-containing protein n=1 Tax=Apatococcus fuscideae TaxID=2026836 RepID=A0AAW1SR74_9CHLO
MAVFAELPSVDAMGQAEDLEGFLQEGPHGRSMYRLVRWILSTNRGYLVHLPAESKIAEMQGEQFYLMTNSPEREAAFQRLKAALGPGIYLASNSQTSRAYCGYAAGSMCYSQSSLNLHGHCMALGLCEVAAPPSTADAVAIPDENAVALRYLFVYNSSDFPTVTAESLKMSSRRLPV